MSNDRFDLGGVVVATTLAFKPDPTGIGGLAVDYEKFAQHCEWLIDSGCRGVGPNGSLGEYDSLTDEERRKVVQVAVGTVGDRGIVIAGAHGKGWPEAVRWAQLAKEDGADGVLLLPPTHYKANDDEIVEHFEKVAEVGLPIMVYNNPMTTKVDLSPQLLARLSQIPQVVAVKDFTTDVRRVRLINELCDIDVIAGADDMVLESVVAGIKGWFSGYGNVFPVESLAVYNLAKAGEIEEANKIFRHLVPVFRWDHSVEFTQAIKLGVDMAGHSYGGPCRPPRGPLGPELVDQVRTDTQKALDFFATR